MIARLAARHFSRRVPVLRHMSSATDDVLQITVTGRDRPGIVSSCCQRLEQLGMTMLDVDDIVTHDQVALQMIATAPTDKSVLKDLFTLERDLQLNCSFDVVDPSELESLRRSRGNKQYSVTMLAETITFETLGAVAQTIANQDFNIVRIERLSPLASFSDDGEISVVEITVEGNESIVNSKALRKALVPIQKNTGCDLAVQREGIKKRQKRMVVMDMDSTLIQQEVIDEIARIHGVYDEVAAVTHAAMNGEMDFDESLRARCSKLKGAPESVFDDVYEVIELTPGADDFVRVLKLLGYKVAVLSGGFTQIVDKVHADLGLDYSFANLLEVDENGLLTGEVLGPIVNRERKRDLLITMAQSEGIKPEQCIAVGDGANDLKMLRAAGLGIAFNAKPNVQDEAEYTINRSRLDTVLYLLGMRPRDVPEWLGLRGDAKATWKTQLSNPTYSRQSSSLKPPL